MIYINLTIKYMLTYDIILWNLFNFKFISMYKQTINHECVKFELDSII